MTDRPTRDAPQVNPLIAVGTGAVVGIVWVLGAVLDMGLMEIGLIPLPMLVVAAPALAFYVWARRRGVLD